MSDRCKQRNTEQSQNSRRTMKIELVQTITDTFEGHAQQTETGAEYWLARDIQYLLGYAEWRKFGQVISKAKTACEACGHLAKYHFVDVNKMIELRSGSQRRIDDILLTCYAMFGKNTLAMKAQWNVPESSPMADFEPTGIVD